MYLLILYPCFSFMWFFSDVFDPYTFSHVEYEHCPIVTKKYLIVPVNVLRPTSQLLFLVGLTSLYPL